MITQTKPVDKVPYGVDRQTSLSKWILARLHVVLAHDLEGIALELGYAIGAKR